MIETASGDFVGDCGITLQDIDGAKEHEVGYRIGKAKWGRGYAHEAAAAVVQYGFETLGLNRLCSYMASDHLQSRRVAEKLGMLLEKEYRNPGNRNYLTCVYAISGRDICAHCQGRCSRFDLRGKTCALGQAKRALTAWLTVLHADYRDRRSQYICFLLNGCRTGRDTFNTNHEPGIRPVGPRKIDLALCSNIYHERACNGFLIRCRVFYEIDISGMPT